MTIKITEIFYSLQGESRTVGLPTVFVRLTGCPLRCQYCDSDYAFTGGTQMTVEQIVEEVQQYPAQYVTVTGGEPLAQAACLPLLSQLCDSGREISLETSGALDIAAVDPRVVIVLDLKTPDSGEMHRNRWDNLPYLKPTDQIKFVICSEQDYQWAKLMLQMYQLPQRCQILFSPVEGGLEARTLAEWVLRDGLPVRFQLQLHKILWQDAKGR